MANSLLAIRMTLQGKGELLDQVEKRRSAIMRELIQAATEIGFKVAGDAKRNLDARPIAPSTDTRMPPRIRTHRLSRAITSFVESAPAALRSIVGVLGVVAYGRIQERGGMTPAHEIRPRYKKMLRWASRSMQGPLLLQKSGKVSNRNKGMFVFAKLVKHPGSRIPGRPYLGPAVESNVGFIEARWRAAIERGLNG